MATDIYLIQGKGFNYHEKYVFKQIQIIVKHTMDQTVWLFSTHVQYLLYINYSFDNNISL